MHLIELNGLEMAPMIGLIAREKARDGKGSVDHPGAYQSLRIVVSAYLYAESQHISRHLFIPMFTNILFIECLTSVVPYQIRIR